MRKIMLHFYVWLMTVFFGAMLSETIILYPNVFHNVPDSLGVAMNFLKVIGPRQFFVSLGGVLIVTAIVTSFLNWRNTEVRIHLISSFLLVFLFEFLLSVYYFWPRNTIMFVEGIASHSRQELQTAAKEFQLGHFFRLAVALIASILAFFALAKDYKQQQI